MKNAVVKSTKADDKIVSLLLRAITPSIEIHNFSDCNKWRKGEESLRAYIISDAGKIEVISSMETYFNDEVLRVIDSNFCTALFENLHGLVVADTGIPAPTKNELLELAFVGKELSFLSKAFLYSIKPTNILAKTALANIQPTALKINNTTSTPLAQSIISKGFERVFTEVPHNETLTLANLKCVRTYHLDLSSNQIKFNDMQNFLYRNIGRYVFSRLELENFRINDELETVVAQALARIKDAGLSTAELADGLGDMILYAFLEFVLKAPKLYNKIELIETAGGGVIGQGGVHLLPLDANGSSFQLVVGKSNIVGNLKSAIDNAFKAIASANTTAAEKKEYKLLDNTILNKSFDPATAEYLKSIVLPQKRKTGVTVDDAFGIFLGYSLDLDANGLCNDEYRAAAKQKMADDIKNHLPYIQTAITNAKLEGRSFYIYLLPFNNADSDKSQIMQELLGVDDE